MAARRLKPPVNLTNKQTNTTSEDLNNEILEISDNDHNSCSQIKKESSNNNNFTTRKSANCKCTNISIMHLFHEMKQQFPTVPDQIVNQCVNDNCHDRENCIIILRNELDLNPMPVQAYPSKALLQRSQQNHQRKSIEQNFADDNQINCLSSTQQTNGDCCPSLSIDVKDKEDSKLVLGNKSHNNIIVKEKNPAVINGVENPSTQKRPTTLNLNSNSNSLHKNQSGQLQENYQRKNTRKPPLPPSLTKPSSSSSLLPENIENSQCNLTSPVKNACESEVSLNISLSPISELRRQRQISSKTTLSSPSTPATPGTPPGTQRHRSFISVQPEPSYTREFLSPSNQKSFTSVNLTLRQPNTSIPKSTIDITAGPGQSGLSYSSTSYDARRGYQKNFHITVTDDGGVFSASRIRPSSCYSPSVQHLEEEFNGNQMASLRTSISEQNFLQNINPLIATGIVSGNHLSPDNDSQDDMFCDVQYDVLQKQIKRKEKLSAALKDNKRRLLQVQQEIEMLTQPINAIESEQLENDIKRLRYDCQKILNEIENLKRSDANEDSYSINNMQQSFPRQKPPRPPCSRATHNLMQQHTAAIASEQNHRQFENSYDIDSQMRQQNNHQNHPHNFHHSNNHQQFQNDTSTDEEEFSEEVNSSEEECPKWACEMCTFRNHPLLNKCECCDNVRIIPGTIRIVSALPSTLLPVVATNANAATINTATTLATSAAMAATTTTATTNPFILTQIPSSLTQSNNLHPNNSTENENLTSQQQLALHS